MQLTLDLEEDEIPAVLKALTNERDRHRNMNRWSTGEEIQHAVTQIEEQSRKPVKSETAAVIKVKRA